MESFVGIRPIPGARKSLVTISVHFLCFQTTYKKPLLINGILKKKQQD